MIVEIVKPAMTDAVLEVVTTKSEAIAARITPYFYDKNSSATGCVMVLRNNQSKTLDLAELHVSPKGRLSLRHRLDPVIMDVDLEE